MEDDERRIEKVTAAIEEYPRGLFMAQSEATCGIEESGRKALHFERSLSEKLSRNENGVGEFKSRVWHGAWWKTPFHPQQSGG